MSKPISEQKLTERLNFEGDDVFLDGKVIFSVPHRQTQSDINVLGVPQHGREIYVGSGSCCYGFITILHNGATDSETPKFKLDGFRIPDFNVYDIIPASGDYKKTGFGNDGAILTTGFGCAGSGVRLIDTYYPKMIEVVPGIEFQEMWNSRVQNFVMPRLNVNEYEGKITLDLLRSGYRLKPGKSRDPKLPSCVLDANAQEWYVSQDIWASKDLTPVLDKLGLDVEKTIEANRGYTRIRH